MLSLASFTTLLAASATLVSARPVELSKRINQIISASTAQWEQACLAAGGGQRCNPLSVAAFSTLLAAPGPCAQQDAADNMIDLALQLNNNAEMIRLTQIFRQQPRNAPDSLSVLYCQNAPRNQQLQGLFQCQFQGVNDNVFTGNVALGQPGTRPLGVNNLNPLGSCPANPNGKIPDGVQLVTLVNSPGTGAGNGAANPAPAPPASSSAAAPAPTANPPANNNNNNNNNNNAGGGNATGFQAQNARDAQALNQQFASLTVGSACTVGQVACLSDGSFAQCPFGTFVATPCAGGTQCMALPLVNSVGTSVTCTTADDAARRFEAAGVSGGATGRQAAAPAPAPAPAPTTPAAPPAGNNNNNNNAGSGNATGFQAQNARNAQALNQQFASLTVGSACTVGQVACLSDGSFAQCPNGTFVSTPCAGGTQCIALPLVNSVGTSVTCTTLDDAARRFEAAGVSGGFNGSQ